MAIPVSVIVEYNEKKKVATITDQFNMDDGSTKSFDDMDDDNMLVCLTLATQVGKQLEHAGYKVNY